MPSGHLSPWLLSGGGSVTKAALGWGLADSGPTT